MKSHRYYVAESAFEAIYLAAKFLLSTHLLRVTPRCQVWANEWLMTLFIERRFEEENGHLFF